MKHGKVLAGAEPTSVSDAGGGETRYDDADFGDSDNGEQDDGDADVGDDADLPETPLHGRERLNDETGSEEADLGEASPAGDEGDPLECSGECWEADTAKYPSCRGYKKVGYTCVGKWCAACDPSGDPSLCAKKMPAGTAPNPDSGKCEAATTPAIGAKKQAANTTSNATTTTTTSTGRVQGLRDVIREVVEEELRNVTDAQQDSVNQEVKETKQAVKDELVPVTGGHQIHEIRVAVREVMKDELKPVRAELRDLKLAVGDNRQKLGETASSIADQKASNALAAQKAEAAEDAAKRMKTLFIGILNQMGVKLKKAAALENSLMS